ncbi:uncharacterized protein [Eurosta solidaginis]|uniref:uncharacterized protein n=1 Tax=Eurosta solidaginis TaxID=178769 RepID=UPI003531191F
MTSVRNNAVSTALLLGWVIFGCLNCSVLAEPQKSSEKSGQDNQDVGDYDEASPENIKVPTKAEPTLKPYFDEDKKIVYAKQDSKVILNCPAKNYDEEHHVIIWSKNNNTIATGRDVLVDASQYQLDKDMNLIINKVSEKTKGDYYCSIMPQNVRMNIVLEIGEQPTTDKNRQMMVTASVLCLVLSLLARELSFGIVSLDNIF